MSFKVILIGFGNIAEKCHLPTYMEQGIEVVGVVDICSKRRGKAAEYGISAYKNLEEVGTDADLMDLCTPPNYRLEALKFAGKHGMDVICEKPLALTEDISSLKKLIKENSLFLFPVHNWKYAPHYREIKDLIRDNGISEIEMNTYRDGYNHGNPDWNPDWRVKREISGGGILMDHGYHNIYLAMYLMGKDFKKIRLKEIDFFPDSKVEKRARFELLFPEKVEVNLDWYAGRREIKNTIYSDGGVIQLLDDKIIVNGIERNLNGISRDSIHKEWYTAVLQDFLRLKEKGDLTCYQEAVNVLEGLAELYKKSNNFIS